MKNFAFLSLIKLSSSITTFNITFGHTFWTSQKSTMLYFMTLILFYLLLFAYGNAFTVGEFHDAASRIGAVEETRTFRALFGVKITLCPVIFETCGLYSIRGIQAKHLLWALLFLKIYGTEDELCSLARKRKKVTRKTFRKWCWIVLEAIAKTLPDVIQLGSRFRGDRGRACVLSVDGVDTPLGEMRPFDKDYNPRFFSHKLNRAAYRYETGICIQTGHLFWVNGPFKAGDWSDLKIFRRDLKGLLRPGEMVEADRGYRGDSSIRTPDDVANRRDKRANEVARARHETVNGKFKRFNALTKTFRHDRKKHKTVFSATAVIVQLSIENGERPFRVNY